MSGRKQKNWLSPERREPGGFAALPHCLLESKVYIGLSAQAVKLLIDLLAQFKGFNNGDLCLSWSIMEKRGWKSRDTLNKARKELLDIEMIMVARYGDRKHPHLYALTFFAIDECGGKLDIRSTVKPLSLWRLHESFSPLKIKLTPTPGVSNVVDMTRPPCYELRSFLVPVIERVININYSIKEAINGSNKKAVQTRADGESAARD